MKKTLYCIVGETGSGKDTITDALCKKLGWSKVVSFTDAPIRSDQVDGREHWFLTKEGFDTMLKDSEVIAYTQIGNNRYMATMEQIDHKTRFYIIDPKGVEYLKENFGSKLNIIIFYIYVPEEERKLRTMHRKNFDFDARLRSEKEQFEKFKSEEMWDIRVRNDNLDDTVRTIYDCIKVCEDRIDSAERKKTAYVDRYRRCVQEYFADKTEEGGMTKHYRNMEIEYVLAKVFDMPESEIKRIFDVEYWKTFGGKS